MAFDSNNDTQISETSALKEVIEESKQRLAEKAPVPVAPKKRGRKPGQKNKTHSDSAQADLGAADPFPPAPQIPQPSLAHVIGPLIAMPFAVQAAKTGFDGWKLIPAEQTALGEQGDAVFKMFFPPEMLNSKWGALSMFCISLMVIGVTREMTYQSWLTTQPKAVEKKVEGEIPVTAAEPNAGGIPTMQNPETSSYRAF